MNCKNIFSAFDLSMVEFVMCAAVAPKSHSFQYSCVGNAAKRKTLPETNVIETFLRSLSFCAPSEYKQHGFR